MAEAAVNFALEGLRSLVVHEIKLLGSAKQEVEEIKSELQIIRSFLKDAEERASEGEGNEGVKTWVIQVREEAYRIEDVIDEFSLSMAQLPHASGQYKICRWIKKLKLQHGIAIEIKKIKSSLANIQQRTQRYGFRSIYQEGSMSESRHVIPHDSRVGSFFIEDDEVVGIESTKDKLTDWLVNERSQRSVIAVVGEGGSGKTTLAGKIYNKESLKKHFDCQAWITVGKEFIKKDLLRAIVQEFNILTASTQGGIEKMEEKALITTLREHLNDKCYMIVFDDVWKLQFWGDVEHALLDNNNNSRIMLTTRNRGVADFFKQSSIVQVHLVEPLAPDDAWQLFCRKAFRFNTIDGFCPPELQELSKNIVAKCGGLPLAVAAVGGLLSTKNKNISEWKKLLDGLGSKLESDPFLESCNRVLSEGFNDLPHHLKSCLLYFGLFPEGYLISCGRLIRLWIAEGFVLHSKRPREQAAEEYLTELIDRSLVQISKRKVSGRAKNCRVHDMMHEVILRKTKELGFSRILNREEFNHSNQMIRRISAHKDTDCSLVNIKESKLRSVLFCNVDKLPVAFLTIAFVSNFKLLKVLDFENAPLECLPEGVGKLFHLHYLSMRNTKVKTLPYSIGKLINLETLDLRGSFVGELPMKICNLKKLRYLLLHHWVDDFTCRTAVKIQEGIGSLVDLRKLELVQGNNCQVIKELKKLRQLRRLGICLESNADIKLLFASIKNMENLETLDLHLKSKEECPDLQSVASPPQSLQSIRLYINYIQKLPFWIFELQNPIRIGLKFKGSIVEPLSVLQALPNLMSLRLEATDNDEQLHFKQGWFPNLRMLSLCNLKGLKLMMIDNGALPNLRKMYIGPYPLLRVIPIGIEYLRNLKILLFRNMLEEVNCMMKDQNWENVTKHIPEIRVSYNKRKGKRYSYFSAKYLSSLSRQDFDELIIEVGRREEQLHL